MNKELIHKLFFDATRVCEEKAVNDAWLFEEEFARLIVQECNDILETFDCQFEIETIKDHFGIWPR